MKEDHMACAPVIEADRGRQEAPAAVKFICDLAKKNSEALSFIPTPRLEQYVADDQVVLGIENGQPAGFIVHGLGWPQMRIYQACVQYDARRMHHGLSLLVQVERKALATRCTDIRLWCADDLDANVFWATAGFRYVTSRTGGVRRGRLHNLWVKTLEEPPLLAALGAVHGERSGAHEHKIQSPHQTITNRRGVMEASIDFNEYLNLRQQVKTAREALVLADDVLSRFPYSAELWPNGTHPNTGIEQIRAALKLLDHPHAG